jgi:hypothetical protein
MSRHTYLVKLGESEETSLDLHEQRPGTDIWARWEMMRDGGDAVLGSGRGCQGGDHIHTRGTNVRQTLK